MGSADEHGLGYLDVDGDQHANVLVDAMDATARWEATRRLRSWERQQLHLVPGERILDVGCGRGEASAVLVQDVGENGELVGIDTSAVMLDVARGLLATAPCPVRLAVGDAHALTEPDRSFDVVRSERTLQWLQRPDEAVVEFVRLLRPGGRLSLIDTDWSSLRLDVGDPRITAAVRDAFAIERNRPSNVGRRLADLVRAAGCEPLASTSATQVWSDWNPDETPAPTGCFSMPSMVEDLVDSGHLDDADAPGVVRQIEGAARDGRFTMTLDVHAIVAMPG